MNPFLSLLLSCLLFAFETTTAQPVPAARWEPYSETGDFYPAFAITVANIPDSTLDVKGDVNIGDPNGILGIVFTSDHNDTRIRVQLTCASEPRLFAPVTLDAALPEAGEEYRVTPVLLFDQARLALIRQPATVSITYLVTIDGKPQPPRTEPLRIHSINDCPLVMTDHNDEASMDWTLAAYVNEDYIGVASLIQEAQTKLYVRSFPGYQSEEIGIYKQVLAIWRVLYERGKRYTNIDGSAAANGPVAMQPILLLDESIPAPKASCADGSILLASVLRSIGINPIVVTIPGHFFVGFDLDDTGKKQAYLETTMMGVTPVYSTEASKVLAAQLSNNSLDTNTQAAVKSFVAAIEAANQTYELHRIQIESGKNGYAAVDIFEARLSGIQPLPIRQ